MSLRKCIMFMFIVKSQSVKNRFLNRIDIALAPMHLNFYGSVHVGYSAYPTRYPGCLVLESRHLTLTYFKCVTSILIQLPVFCFAGEIQLSRAKCHQFQWHLAYYILFSAHSIWNSMRCKVARRNSNALVCQSVKSGSAI